jgi:hypothetical protein
MRRPRPPRGSRAIEKKELVDVTIRLRMLRTEVLREVFGPKEGV